MKNKPFHFEIKDIIYQFITAFNDVVMQEYNEQRVSQGQIRVPFIYQPKGRVLHDIINQEKNMVLPCISIVVTNVKQNLERSKNKQQAFYSGRQSSGNVGYFKNAVPVDITVRMSIITKFQQDMDQIISNFQTQATPFVVLVWRLPKTLGFDDDYIVEIPVSWSGDLPLQFPTELQENEKQLITVDTTFTIPAWLFRERNLNPSGFIYEINADFAVPSDITIINYSTPLSSIEQIIDPTEQDSFVLSSLSS